MLKMQYRCFINYYCSRLTTATSHVLFLMKEMGVSWRACQRSTVKCEKLQKMYHGVWLKIQRLAVSACRSDMRICASIHHSMREKMLPPILVCRQEQKVKKAMRLTPGHRDSTPAVCSRCASSTM